MFEIKLSGDLDEFGNKTITIGFGCLRGSASSPDPTINVNINTSKTGIVECFELVCTIGSVCKSEVRFGMH